MTQLFYGIVNTTMDALLLVEAARQGKIPRIIRRLNNSERQEMVKSGAVFVFSVEESGIKRWTDSMLWSPSRIDGNFLIYTEMLERAPRKSQKRKKSKSDLTRTDAYDSSWPSTPSSPNSVIKVGGMLKKTITVTTNDGDLHIVSYFLREDVLSGALDTVSSKADIASTTLDPGRLDFSRLRYPPRLQVDKRGLVSLVCDSEPDEFSIEGSNILGEDCTELYTHDLPSESRFRSLEQGPEIYTSDGRWQSESRHGRAGHQLPTPTRSITAHSLRHSVRLSRLQTSPSPDMWRRDGNVYEQEDTFPDSDVPPHSQFHGRYQDSGRRLPAPNGTVVGDSVQLNDDNDYHHDLSSPNHDWSPASADYPAPFHYSRLPLPSTYADSDASTSSHGNMISAVLPGYDGPVPYR
ncbi:hypothetical protein HWV62_18614 [Athelia sp. TMB]|nr:hypothetical protein HWV62_18614 [Athelia sp. TMB]